MLTGAAPPWARPLPVDPEVGFAEALARVAAAAGRVGPGSLFMIQPTSGSTGTPKLVRRTHRAFARYAGFVGRELAGPERLRFLAAAALTHAFGLHVLTTAVALGAELCVPSAVSTPPPRSPRCAPSTRPSCP